MTTEEFSNEFDTLLNSHAIADGFGMSDSIGDIKLDEYEKSVFLTKAQEDLILSYYNGKNPSNDSFEKTEEIRRYLSNLVTTYSTSNKETGYEGLSENSVFFELPEDVWFITYESVILEDAGLGCMNGSSILVVPVTQDDYFKIIKNPFRGPNKKRALRLDLNDNIVEIISNYNIDRYVVRYLAKPSPIILTNLTDGLSINGINTISECELNPVLHRAILERAVNLAIASKSINTINNKQNV